MIVRLVGTEALLPTGMAPRAAVEWLAAPIGGQPLFRRLLETYVGLDIAAIVTDDGPVGRAFRVLAEREGVFGWPVRTRSEFSADAHVADRPVLVTDGATLIDADLRAAFRARAGRSFLLHAGRKIVGGYVHAPADRRAVLAVLHKETMLDRLLGAVSEDLDAVAVETLSLRSASEVHCLAIAVAEGDLPSHPPFGRRRGDLLLGPRAIVSAGAHVRGACEVGAETKISGEAVLGHGAVIGARAYVGHGALVTESIILDGAVVRAGEVVRGRIRGKDFDLELSASEAPPDEPRMHGEFSTASVQNVPWTA